MLKILTMTAGAAAAQTPEFDALKAAFVFNFAKFTGWPSEKLSATTINFCFEVGSILPEVIDSWESKSVQGRGAQARLYSLESNAISECHVLYLAEWSDRTDRAAFVQASNKHHILLVSDANGFAQQGGHIRLKEIGGRIRFEVNVENTAKAGLTLSSQLLRLAEITGGES